MTKAGLTEFAGGVRFERKILRIRTLEVAGELPREVLDVVPDEEGDEEDEEDIDAIVADDGTFKRPPLRRGALVPDEGTKQLIRNAIAKAGTPRL